MMKEGRIFDIQHFGVHDGPGIRTLVFMKGCPLRCAWCCNPESHSADSQLRYVNDRCKACHTCVSACIKKAVSPLEDSVSIDFSQCAGCAEKPCIEACNHGALNLAGYAISSGDLLGIISKDVAFYRNSGGGATFTGGEPLSQPEFLAEILDQCKKNDIHTAIETCGYCKRSDLEAIVPLTDLFLFDIKIIDPDKHRQYTGQSNQVILDNLEYLSSTGKRIIIRFPLIPDITDTPENISGVIELMNRLGLKDIDLEPYHDLGTPKYAELGKKYPLHGIAGDSGFEPDRLSAIREMFATFLR